MQALWYRSPLLIGRYLFGKSTPSGCDQRTDLALMIFNSSGWNLMGKIISCNWGAFRWVNALEGTASGTVSESNVFFLSAFLLLQLWWTWATLESCGGLAAVFWSPGGSLPKRMAQGRCYFLRETPVCFSVSPRFSINFSFSSFPFLKAISQFTWVIL